MGVVVDDAIEIDVKPLQGRAVEIAVTALDQAGVRNGAIG